ncbi:MAG TPA: SPFH domain-containing protein [Tepidisphaeraceae bacterium]|nr:SPFH domain-containing protein [Tepidisphaeraceae bacterium]
MVLILADDTNGWAIAAGVALLALVVIWILLGSRRIANSQVGIVEKLWSTKGSIAGGRIIALSGEAGYQARILRGGLHFFYWPWQYRIHRCALVSVGQGKIGYVYARDGEPLPPSQTLGHFVDCNHFQDAPKFLASGQRGRQRAILREGVYAINFALFVVVTEDRVYQLAQGREEMAAIVRWQKELDDIDGFDPVVVGAPVEVEDPLVPGATKVVDSLAIVTVHDGPSLAPGEIIAPAVGNDGSDSNYHNNYQDPEAFLRGGGRRGRQYVPLTDGTYFINRWFATIEVRAKSVVPIGYVGVVVSYYGPMGQDVSGEAFRHGERVVRGERGVWERPLGPGKYPFNEYAGKLILVPTTNFVLHWITGKTEAHRYDETLRSIDLVTKDAYEPLLPLSIVVHIDYQRAPSVIQRFGDVKKLITQTLDPMLSAYFRDVAHQSTMLELLQNRDSIQVEAQKQLQTRFRDFDIECVDVLIGKPDTAEGTGIGKIETLLEQLRMRQLSIEQLETYDRQRAAAEKLKTLNEAQAIAAKQAELTNSQIQANIAENQGQADLARARKQAEQTVVVAEAELARSRRQAEQTVVTAQAESQSRILAGRGESTRSLQVGLAEATVLLRSITSFGDPRLYALTKVAEHLAKATQPLVPDRVFISGGAGNGEASSAGAGMVGMLMNLLVAEKSGFSTADNPEMASLKELADKMTKQVMATMEEGNGKAASVRMS